MMIKQGIHIVVVPISPMEYLKSVKERKSYFSWMEVVV